MNNKLVKNCIAVHCKFRLNLSICQKSENKILSRSFLTAGDKLIHKAQVFNTYLLTLTLLTHLNIKYLTFFTYFLICYIVLSFDALAAKVLISNSNGLCWPEGTTIQQEYSVC